VKYAKSSCNREKTKLYEVYIQPAFSEMVDKITYTYKFTTLPNIDDLRDECKVWLTTILGKYDPKKGSKAFSYFSVITKNWFIHKVKKNSTKVQREVQLDEVTKDLREKYVSSKNVYMEKREKNEFWSFLLKELKKWENGMGDTNSNSNDVRVLKAIQELLGEPEEVEILNKKAIYLYMREITGLNTKQIANSLKKYRIKYQVFKEEWNKGKI
tara:strand:+ start:634 stop:1272 length:639 start_codon:yes stop_codon:yes gene_type:complete